VDFTGLVRRFEQACEHSKYLGSVARDANAADLWGRDNKPQVGAYQELTKDQSGLCGAVLARGAPQVLRLSLLYALLDCSREIRQEHLLAALEVWRYCRDSARYIFGEILGDPTADEILKALRRSPAGLTRTDIAALFDRNKSANEIKRALDVLTNEGRARFETEETGGRPIERWFAVWKDPSEGTET
jgi:hypothetical protein